MTDLRKYITFTRSIRSPRAHEVLWDFEHGVLGMVSEIEELLAALKNEDQTNLIEEIGDMFFYYITLCDAAPTRFDGWCQHAVGQTHRTNPSTVRQLGAEMLDRYKKLRAYGDQTQVVLIERLADRLMAAAFKIAPQVSPQTIIEANYRKLSKRYKEGKFTKEAAMHRDLDSERAALNG